MRKYGRNMKGSDVIRNSFLTLSSLNLPLSSSSTTSRELLPQFSTCSGRCLEVCDKLKEITLNWKTSFMVIFDLKPLVIGKLSLFSGM